MRHDMDKVLCERPRRRARLEKRRPRYRGPLEDAPRFESTSRNRGGDKYLADHLGHLRRRSPPKECSLASPTDPDLAPPTTTTPDATDPIAEDTAGGPTTTGSQGSIWRGWREKSALT